MRECGEEDEGRMERRRWRRTGDVLSLVVIVVIVVVVIVVVAFG